ncbi:MAG: RsmB/NOP family class I SAM-dependent RNA methyltransferase [Candidatus Pacearchaeota archaeon]|nr:RsmB/NOP family class I SAM-dependent RNA methyltransferase [Candidatus Pacearchaeota archaeon]
MIEAKPEFIKRIEEMLENETQKFLECIRKPLLPSIRVNTLKISEQELKIKLEKKGWKISKIFENAFVIKSKLLPGELGKSLEHQLGYYYVQELASMLPPLILEPKKDDVILDLCAAPGSKTTEIAAMMENQGTVIANDVKLERITALNSNLERCGVTNTIVTRMKGSTLCKKLAKSGFFFDKILVDAPCSGEGIIRSSPETLRMWNVNMIKGLSALQKKLVAAAIECLKPNGVLVYSTCTHTPEENEFVIDFVLKNFDVKLEEIKLPLKTRQGIAEWQNQKLNDELRKCVRIWPQDNDTEGFFIAKIRKLK